MASALTNLEKDITRIDDVMAGALSKFGELGKAGNKQWTLFARIASGSWLWRFQARLRALSNAVELYTDAQKKHNEELITSLKLEGQLVKSGTRLEKGLEFFKNAQIQNLTGIVLDPDMKKKLESNDLFQSLMGRNKGDVTAALMQGIKIYTDQMAKHSRAVDIAEKGLLKYYGEKAAGVMGNFKDAIDKMKPKDIFNNFLDVTKKIKTMGVETVKDVARGPMKLIGGVGDFVSKKLEPGKSSGFLENWSKIQLKSPLGKLQEKLMKGFIAIPALLKKVLPMLGKMLMGFVLYGVLFITVVMLLVGFFRKLWPAFTDIMSKFKPIFELAFDGLMDILSGVFDLVVAIWEGRWWDAMKAFFVGIIGGLLKLLTGLALGIMATLLSAAVAMSVAIVKGIWGVIKKFIPGMSTGGVTQGGLNLVGERGPELVKLPAGSRVMSNANSRSMAGNTINVHVNGRVGASDAEIKDIANKVAREINIRMNRQGTIAMGG